MNKVKAVMSVSYQNGAKLLPATIIKNRKNFEFDVKFEDGHVEHLSGEDIEFSKSPPLVSVQSPSPQSNIISKKEILDDTKDNNIKKQHSSTISNLQYVHRQGEMHMEIVNDALPLLLHQSQDPISHPVTEAEDDEKNVISKNDKIKNNDPAKDKNNNDQIYKMMQKIQQEEKKKEQNKEETQEKIAKTKQPNQMNKDEEIEQYKKRTRKE